MVCRKRSCYDTRNCFIDSLASRLHILQFVTWPISIFQADVDKNPSAPHTRLHFVMTWRMLGGRGKGPGRAATFFLLPVPSHPPPPPSKEDGGRESRPASPSLLALLALVPGMLQAQPHDQCPPESLVNGGELAPALSSTIVLTHGQEESLGLVCGAERTKPGVTS